MCIMNPQKTDRNNLQNLTDLPNIGKAMAQKLQLLGINQPAQLKGKSPYDLYAKLCQKTKVKHDPCVLDVFISITRFMAGDEPKHWWAFTQERKDHINNLEVTK